jgi:DNA-binding transcriptional MerR regulator
MAIYSIKEMSILSGVKPHTIRIWEKRYNLFSPQRTDTNIRRYNDDDLKLILNVSLLLSMGYKISRIAKLSDVEIRSIMLKGRGNVQTLPFPETLFNSAMEINELEFSRKIEETISERGFEWTFENMLVPFQKRMGLLWQAGTVTPAQEHFASNIIRNKIIKQTDSLPNPNDQISSVLFFLPEGELHEMGLLYFNYIARKEGLNTVYLGQTVPLNNILEFKTQKDFLGIFTTITISISREEIASMIGALKQNFPNSRLMATGLQIELDPSLLPKGVEIIKSAQQFKSYLKKINLK